MEDNNGWTAWPQSTLRPSGSRSGSHCATLPCVKPYCMVGYTKHTFLDIQIFCLVQFIIIMMVNIVPKPGKGRDNTIYYKNNDYTCYWSQCISMHTESELYPSYPTTTPIPNLVSSVQWLIWPLSNSWAGKGDRLFSTEVETVPWEFTLPFIVMDPTSSL